MKTLTLLRHAKSSWDDTVATDFERPLNRRGQAAARAMGREMRARGLVFDAVRASPATRVVQTLARLAESYGRDLDPAYDRDLYLAAGDALLEAVRDMAAECDRLLLAGHNPGLERLALTLLPDDGDTGRASIAEKYPTGALVEIALPVSDWKEVAPGMGRLVRFIRPRDLDPALGPDGT